MVLKIGNDSSRGTKKTRNRFKKYGFWQSFLSLNGAGLLLFVGFASRGTEKGK